MPTTTDGGDPLIDLLQDDWSIFDEAFFESGRADGLLSDALRATWDDDDGEPPIDVHELYTLAHGVGYREEYEDFLAAAREDESVEPEFSDVLAEDLTRMAVVLAAGTILHRARPGFDRNTNNQRTPWSGPAIGANPHGPAGRANRQGKVVLYAAFEQRTAVAEVRPARGQVISVCELRLTRDIRVLDLTRTLHLGSPFEDGDGLIPYWIELAEIFANFAELLSEPLERTDEPADYWPSQRLSEYFETAGFDGIRYRSALHFEGQNLVLFDPEAYEILQSELVKVAATKIDYYEI